MTVNTVVTGVELSADEPFPERRVARVQSGVPVLVPAQHVGIFFEALREFIDAESLVYRRIGQVRLANEFGGGMVIFFLLPMDRNLRLVDVGVGLASCLCFVQLCFLRHRMSVIRSIFLMLSRRCDHCIRRSVPSGERS